MHRDTPHKIPLIARPVLLVGVPAGLYGLLSIPLGLVMLSESHGKADGEAMVVWGLFSLVPCLLGALAGVVASGRERLLANRSVHSAQLWIMTGALALLGVHWLPLLAWTPLALFRVILQRLSDSLFSATLWGLAPWAVLVGVLFAGAAVWRAFQRPTVGAAGPGPVGIYRALAAVLVGISTTPVVLGAMVAVAAGGDGQGLATSAVLILGGLGAIAGVGLGWSTASARGLASPQVRGLWTRTFWGTLGAFLILLAASALFATGWPMWEQALGQRFGVQMVFTCVLALGVALRSVQLSGPTTIPA